MATYNVSTWAELLSALNQSASQSRTIKITADIDCNDEIPMGVSSTIQLQGSGNYPLYIDGSYTDAQGNKKNHVIRNLRTHTTSPVDIFKTLSSPGGSDSGTYLYVYIRNIDFINLVLAGASFLGVNIGSSYTSNYQQVNFNSCRFVGRRDRYLVRSIENARNASDNGIYYTSCFFNMPYKPSGSTANTYVPLNQVWAYISGTNRCFANYCRFKDTYGGWDIGQFVPTVSVAPQCCTHNLYLNGCYIYGQIIGDSTIGISNHYTYNPVIQNVVDADLYVTNGGSAGSSINIYAPKGIYRNKITKWNTTPEIAYVDNNQNASAISVPPDKMTDPAYLYSQGFDIVVPE